jgi:hypothetical protein
MGKKNKNKIWKAAYDVDHTRTICTGNPTPFVAPPFEEGDVVILKSESDGFSKRCGVKPDKEYIVDACWWSIGQTTPSWMLYLPGIGEKQSGMRPFKKNEDGTIYRNEQGHCEQYGEAPWMHQPLYPEDFEMAIEKPDDPDLDDYEMLEIPGWTPMPDFEQVFNLISPHNISVQRMKCPHCDKEI